MEKYWQVEVSVAGESVLVISDNHLSGREDAADYADTIAGCAEHLLSFIGRKSQGHEAAEAENARLLQSALASQRDADKLLGKLHAAERERERYKAALKTVAEMPISEQDNMVAANMRKVAAEAVRP